METKSPEKLIGHQLNSEDDYPAWIFDVNCLLEEKDVSADFVKWEEADTAAARAEIISGQSASRVSRCLIVRGGLIRSLGESAHKIVRSAGAAHLYELIALLKSKYSSKKMSSRHSALAGLLTTAMKDGETVQDFVQGKVSTFYEKLSGDIKADEVLLAAVLLNAAPRFRNVTSTLLTKENLTIAEVESALKEWDVVSGQTSGESDAAVNLTKADAKTARQIQSLKDQVHALKAKGGKGRKGKGKGKRGVGVAVVTCKHCSKSGHSEKQCWAKHPHLNPHKKKKEAAGKTAKAKVSQGMSNWVERDMEEEVSIDLSREAYVDSFENRVFRGVREASRSEIISLKRNRLVNFKRNRVSNRKKKSTACVRYMSARCGDGESLPDRNLSELRVKSCQINDSYLGENRSGFYDEWCAKSCRIRDSYLKRNRSLSRGKLNETSHQFGKSVEKSIVKSAVRSVKDTDVFNRDIPSICPSEIHPKFDPCDSCLQQDLVDSLVAKATVAYIIDKKDDLCIECAAYTASADEISKAFSVSTRIHPKLDSVSFIVDSGASHNMVKDKCLIKSYTDIHMSLKTADGLSRTKGTIVELRPNSACMRYALFHPQLSANLLSTEVNAKSGGKFVHTGSERIVIDESGRKHDAYLDGGLPHIKVDFRSEAAVHSATVNSTINSKEALLTHQRVCHLNVDFIKCRCTDCAKGKSYGQVSHKKERPAACKIEEILEQVDTDFCGPFPLSHSKNKYTITFIDVYSGWVEVYCLSCKSQAHVALQQFCTAIGKQQRIRSDNEPTFKGAQSSWKETCRKLNIVAIHSIPYEPQTNSLAERWHRAMGGCLRSSLVGVDPLLWDHCCRYISYVFNRVQRKVGKETPFLKRFHRQASIRHLRRFGCLCFAKIHTAVESKLAPRYETGVFLGFARESSSYLVGLFRHCGKTVGGELAFTVIENRSVKFFEDVLVSDIQMLKPDEPSVLHRRLQTTTSVDVVRRVRAMCEGGGRSGVNDVSTTGEPVSKRRKIQNEVTEVPIPDPQRKVQP